MAIGPFIRLLLTRGINTGGLRALPRPISTTVNMPVAATPPLAQRLTSLGVPTPLKEPHKFPIVVNRGGPYADSYQLGFYRPELRRLGGPEAIDDVLQMYQPRLAEYAYGGPWGSSRSLGPTPRQLGRLYYALNSQSPHNYTRPIAAWTEGPSVNPWGPLQLPY